MPFSIMLPYRAKKYQHLNIKKTQMPKIQWVQQFTVSRILLCPAIYCLQNITVSSNLLSPEYYCVQQFIVSRILLCPAICCLQNITVSSNLLFQPKYSVPKYFWYALVQFSIVDMLQSYHVMLGITLYICFTEFSTCQWVCSIINVCF
jgi:hypothetical protein